MVVIVQDDAVAIEKEVLMRQEETTAKEEEVLLLVSLPLIEAQRPIHDGVQTGDRPHFMHSSVRNCFLSFNNVFFAQCL